MDTPDTLLLLDRFLAEVEKRAYRMAYIATLNDADALDIVQDAMFKLVDRYAKTRSDDWPMLFHRILQNKITDWHRRQQVRRKLFVWLRLDKDDESDRMETNVENAAGSPNHEPDKKLWQTRTGKALDKAINALPLRQQQAFLLREWEGLDVKQTAHAMDCSEGSVKTHYSRAVQALREKLEDHRHE